MRRLMLILLLSGCTCGEPPPEPSAIEARLPERTPEPSARQIAPTSVNSTVNTEAPELEGTTQGASLEPSAGDDPNASPPDVDAKPD
jgi:hypothetical protein